MLYSPFVDEKMGMFIASMTAPALQTIADLMREGKVKTVIDREYTLAETAAAVAYLEEGRARGKIVVRVSADPIAAEQPSAQSLPVTQLVQ
jgi:D-arabinose 1-dehydrogenase-like Zn-dependent alcohol dehydrogenase